IWFVILPLIQQAQREAVAAPIVVGTIVGSAGGCVGLIYPLLLWFFMTRRHVRAAFGWASADLVPAEGALSGPAFPSESSNPYVSPLTAAMAAPDAPATGVDSVVERLVPSKNGPALASYYLGLFSLFPCFGFPLGVAAVYYGIKGLKNVRAD